MSGEQLTQGLLNIQGGELPRPIILGKCRYDGVEALNAINVILAVAVIVVGYFLITPVKTEFMAMMEGVRADIRALNQAIDRLADKVDTTNVELNNLRERMAKAEASTVQAHKRLDGYEGRLVTVEHKCETCGKK